MNSSGRIASDAAVANLVVRTLETFRLKRATFEAVATERGVTMNEMLAHFLLSHAPGSANATWRG